MPRSLLPTAALLVATLTSPLRAEEPTTQVDLGTTPPSLNSLTWRASSFADSDSEALDRALADTPAHQRARDRMDRVLSGEKSLVEADTLSGQAKIDFLEKAARSGDAAAALRLGEMLEHGTDLAPDPTRAVAYYRAATLGGNMEAAHNYGAALAAGRGIRRDYKEALAWLIVARQRGDTSGADDQVRERLQKLGRGPLISEAEKLAESLATEAPAADVIAALPPPAALTFVDTAESTEVVDIVDFGKEASSTTQAGKPQVVVVTLLGRRLTWPTVTDLERAADRGEPAALGALGRLLVAGKLVPADPLRATVLLEKSAAAGDADAAHQLADLFSEGVHVTRDDEKAFTYFLQAARGGSLAAMVNTGAYYTNGRGTPRDYVKGLTWLIVAKRYGLDRGQEARLRSHLAARDPAQVQQAETAAAELIREIDPKVR